MKIEFLPRLAAIVLSIAMVVGGVSLVIWSMEQSASSSPPMPTQDDRAEVLQSPTTAVIDSEIPTPTGSREVVSEEAEATPVPSSANAEPMSLVVDGTVPGHVRQIISQIVLSSTNNYTLTDDLSRADLQVNTVPLNGTAFFESLYAVAARFDTVDNRLPASAVQAFWQGAESTETRFTQVAVISDTLPSLAVLLGAPGPNVYGYDSADAVVNQVWAEQGVLAIIPFDLLVPELTVLAIDGQTPVENDNLFDQSAYPFVVKSYLHPSDPSVDAAAFLQQIASFAGTTNRRSDQMTVIAMTGVTAMVRLTAQQMDQYGPLWPTVFISDTLAAADITAISNEVPFVPGCTTNTSPDNLTFCSPPEYMAALEAVGVDIIGLTGNHQNDYGRDDALVSLQIYADAGLPVYGGGRNKEEAFKPLYLEHNGNRLAFLGANSYGPPFAWATDTGPGSAPFDLNIMWATISNIKERDLADVVLAELQYQESYDVSPLFDQRENFRALSRAGADIVTGVQSHVPQAVEFEEGSLILYGLGNLFFDQMLGATREGLIVKHTIYQGRHLSTQILTTLIYDYGQPQWATEEERASILSRVFDASYWELP